MVALLGFVVVLGCNDAKSSTSTTTIKKETKETPAKP
jgi:hypothetical protein